MSAGILIGIALNLQISLGSTVILTILSLLIYEHETIFLFIEVFLNFFFPLNFLQYCFEDFQGKSSHTSFVKLILSISFFLVLLWMEFLISFLDYWMQVDGNITDFCLFILDPTILLNSFNKILVDFLRYYTCCSFFKERYIFPSRSRWLLLPCADFK